MIFENCELWYAKLDPERPNSRFNKENPLWELQIRTKSKEQKKEWIKNNLIVKDIVPDEGEPYFRVNLRKKSITKKGKEASPVDVIDGKLKPVDPNSIGNGSIGNVRVYQYEYPKADGSRGIVSVLMGIQLTKHIKYIPKPRDSGFDETETEVVDPDEEDEETFEEASHEDESEVPKAYTGKVF
jgi:hypothetical protein